MLGDQPLKPEPTGEPEQVGADIAGLERRDEDAVRPAREQPLQIGLAQVQREWSEPSNGSGTSRFWMASLMDRS